MIRLSIVVPTLTGEVPELPRGEGIEVVVVKGVRPVSAARRQGLSRATGDYVWFVDADDEVDCSLRLEDVLGAERPDIVRFRTACGWMCIGDKIYRREVLEAAFDEIGVLPFKHCEDGLMYLAALKHAKSVREVDRVVYRYIQRPDSALHQFNANVVAERVAFIDRALRLAEGLSVPGFEADRVRLSKESVVYVATQLCQWPATFGQIRRVCRELLSSRLPVDGAAAIAADPYVRKMMFAVRWPILIACYKWIVNRRKG